VTEKVKAFSRIAMPILQPIGADIGDANAVLEAGRAFAEE
jgi:hypothetical protein